MAISQGDSGALFARVYCKGFLHLLAPYAVVTWCAFAIDFILTERGSMFGYGDLVVDARNLPKLRRANGMVVQDVTHR